MGKISRKNAEDLASAMLSKKKERLDRQEKELSKNASNYVEKTIPVDVLEAFIKHPSYFKSTSSVYITGNGFNGQRFNFDRALPLSSSYVTLNPLHSESLLLDANSFDDAEKDFYQTRREIIAALLGLGTYKAIQEALPESLPFIPEPPQTTVLAINISDLRSKLA